MTAATADTVVPEQAVDLQIRWDDWLDRCNPVFVKETRQALKSRVFAIAFLGTLAVTWLVFSLLVATEGDQIEFTDSGRAMFRVVYMMMMIPLWIIVPAMVFTGVSCEFTDSTFEMLAVTPLRPGGIVRGKLYAAAMQAAMYISAMLPFLSMTLLMQGIDILAAGIAMACSLLASTLLSLGGLLAGSLVRGTVSQTFLTVILLAACGLATGIGGTIMANSTLGPWDWPSLGAATVGLFCCAYFLFLYVMMTIGVACERLTVIAPRPLYAVPRKLSDGTPNPAFRRGEAPPTTVAETPSTTDQPSSEDSSTSPRTDDSDSSHGS